MGKSTWLTSFADAWKRVTGIQPNFKRLARELGIVRDTLIDGGLSKSEALRKMQRHWKEYLYWTPAKWLSPTRFRETFKYWDPAVSQRARVEKVLDKENKKKEARLEAEPRGSSDESGPSRIVVPLKGVALPIEGPREQ